MANSTLPYLPRSPGPWWPARTPGVLGYNDQADPNICSLMGDSAGVLGSLDRADPTLQYAYSRNPFLARLFGRSADGALLSLASNGRVPTSDGDDDAITAVQLQAIFADASLATLKDAAAELNTDRTKYGLDTALRRAHFFAQVRQEAGAELQAAVESLNYSPEGLKATFRYYRDHPDEATTDGYERNAKTRKITRHADEEAIANKVYAARSGSGNGDSASGDGWNYRGRGLIQVTGRSNYAQATIQYRKLYGGTDVDFEATPALMANFPYTLRSAVCFWIQHDLHTLADKGSTDADVDRITKVINFYTDSKASRRSHFRTAYDTFQ